MQALQAQGVYPSSLPPGFPTGVPLGGHHAGESHLHFLHQSALPPSTQPHLPPLNVGTTPGTYGRSRYSPVSPTTSSRTRSTSASTHPVPSTSTNPQDLLDQDSDDYEDKRRRNTAASGAITSFVCPSLCMLTSDIRSAFSNQEKAKDARTRALSVRLDGPSGRIGARSGRFTQREWVVERNCDAERWKADRREFITTGHRTSGTVERAEWSAKDERNRV